MNTKFVYLFALLSLAMSSFAVAKAPHARKLKYQTTTPVTTTEAKREEICKAALEQAQYIGQGASACSGNGEIGTPVGREVDSGCKCEPAIASSPEVGNLSCSVGVHWYCEYDRPASAVKPTLTGRR